MQELEWWQKLTWKKKSWLDKSSSLVSVQPNRWYCLSRDSL